MTLFVGTGLEAGLRHAFCALPPVSGAPRLLRGPELIGAGRIGDVLEVDPGTWADAATLSFAWLRNGVPVPGAIETIYAPSANDDQFVIACCVTAKNEIGQTEVQTQAITIFIPPKPVASASTLYIRYTQLTGFHIVIESNFFPDGTLSFRITGDGVSIDTATGLVTIPAASLLSGISVLVTAFGEKTEVDFNLKLNPAFSSMRPALSSGPTLTGTGLVGDELVVQPGVWGGEPVPELTLQWLRDGVPIAGATGPAFTPGAAEDAAGVACRVTATNAAGEAAAETRTVEIVRAAPVATGVLADVVLAQGGAAQERQAASVFAGDALQFSVAGAGVAIDPATGVVTLSTDTLRAAEIITVTAENSGGAATSGFAVTVLAAPTAAGTPAPVVLEQRAGNATFAMAAHFAGSDLVYALEGAPAGAVIDAATGVVTLATDAALTASLEVRATNAAGSAIQSVEVCVFAAPTALGMAGSIVFVAGPGTRTVSMASFFAGQELTYALEAAPPGVTIDAVSGLVTIPNAAALKTTLTVRATNLAGSAIRSFELAILAAPTVVGVPVALVFEQDSGTATISSQAFFAGEDLVYSLDAAPEGVTINPSSGLVSVETDAAFDGAITLHATNAAGSAMQSLAMTIGAEGSTTDIKPAAPLDGEWTLDQITVQK